MRTQTKNSKLIHFIRTLLLLLLLSGLISACNTEDNFAENQIDKPVQQTEGDMAAIATALVEDDLGEVFLIEEGTSDKKVIIFEETHISRAGQLEIALMLVRLYNDYGMRHIALEGLLEEQGPLDGSWYHQLTDRETLADIAIQTLKEGDISNSEFMALTFPDVTVHDIEIAKEYEFEPEDGAWSASTLYLFQIAAPGLTPDEIEEFNRLIEEDKILEAIEYVIDTDEWSSDHYQQLTDDSTVTPIEVSLDLAIEIENKAAEVGAEIDDELKGNFQEYKKFFEIASQRSDTMVNKTLPLLEKYPDKPIGMIIGAAHTDKVAKLFSQQGIAYAVIRQKALITEEHGELNGDAYDRALQGVSVAEAGQLGALLDSRRKPRTVIERPWYQANAQIRAAIIELVRAVANNANPPFDKEPYDLQTKFAKSDYSNISINWDTFKIHSELEPKEIEFSLEAVIDGNGTTRTVWIRAAQTDEPTGDETNTSLEELLSKLAEQAEREAAVEALQLSLSQALEEAQGEANPRVIETQLSEALDIAKNNALTILEQEISEAIKIVSSKVGGSNYLEELLLKALNDLRNEPTPRELDKTLSQMLEEEGPVNQEVLTDMLEKAQNIGAENLIKILSEAQEKATADPSLEAIKPLLTNAQDYIQTNHFSETAEELLSLALEEVNGEANPTTLGELLSEAFEKATDETLRGKVSEALEETRGEADSEKIAEILTEALNDNPPTVRLTPDVAAKVGDSQKAISTAISKG
jgi:hypothetical protein